MSERRYVCEICGFVTRSSEIAEVHDTCHAGEDGGSSGWDSWKLKMPVEDWAAMYLQLPPDQQDPQVVALAKRWIK